MGTVAAVPLVDRGELLGVLTLADHPGRGFTPAELRLLSGFGAQAALAIRNAGLYAEVCAGRDFLHSIAANSADAIVTTDVRGRVTYVSPGAEEMFGYRGAEVLGQPAASFCRSGEAEAEAVMARLRAEGRIRNYETAVRVRDGRWVPVNASISLLRDPGGAVRGTLAVIKDMTERDAAEAARREAAELRAVTLLAGGTAHEINNPLAVIVGRLEMLVGHVPRGSRAAGWIEQSAGAADEIKRIVARMMRITRVVTTASSGSLPPIVDIEKSSEAS